MEVKYHKSFIKNYNNRFQGNKNFKFQYEKRLRLFIKTSENPILKDHALKGKKIGLRSFSITGDIRVIYLLKNKIAYFLDIGTHNQVY